MSSINLLCALKINFDNPWLLFVIIPAIGLMLIPYFRVKKQHRNTPNRVISLAIHTVILVLVTFLLAGMSFTLTQVTLKKDVVLLVDASDSAVSARADMDDFVNSVLDDIDKNHNIGVVTFAGNCVYAAEMDNDPAAVKRAYSEVSQKPIGNASDIAGALYYARDLLSSPTDGRIILLSDGKQTDTNAVSAVRALSNAGVRVDTVYFPTGSSSDEVQIDGVDVRIMGNGADIVVTVQSTVAQSAALSLYDDGTLVESRNVELTGGVETYSFMHTVSDTNVHSIQVTIDASRDTMPQNNTGYSFLNINATSKILLVDGSGNGATDFMDLLDSRFDVTRITVDELPQTVDELCAYGEVILMNVANADLPDGYGDKLTEYVEEHGGGLYTAGGSKAYMEEDMHGTKYEALLPVNARTDAKSIGVMIIFDNSSSMDYKAQGSNETRMSLAKAAAKASVDALSPEDYVGVVSFNSTAINETRGMQPVSTSTAYVKQRIDSIGREEGVVGTVYSAAISMAKDILTPFNKTEKKHIIFLSDGDPSVHETNIEGAKENIALMAQNGITLSFITLGPEVSTNLSEEMAELGGGRHYSVAQETKLLDIMVKETTTAAAQYINREEFTPRIESHTPAVAGVTELPQLDGFYGAMLKDGATKVLDYDGNPIYAEWTVGDGKVASFLCDLEGNWSSRYFTDEEGIRFLANSVNSVLAKTQIGLQPVSIDFSVNNFTAQAEITVNSGSGSITAVMIGPDGAEDTLTLQGLSDTRYATAFKMSDPGVYTVYVTRNNGGTEEKYYAYTAFSYSQEYSAFGNDTEYFEFMQALSSEGGGSLLFSAENLFGGAAEMTSANYDPMLVFLIIVCVLFLADITVRKFKIKTRAERREEKAQKAASAHKTNVGSAGATTP